LGGGGESARDGAGIALGGGRKNRGKEKKKKTGGGTSAGLYLGWVGGKGYTVKGGFP